MSSAYTLLLHLGFVPNSAEARWFTDQIRSASGIISSRELRRWRTWGPDVMGLSRVVSGQQLDEVFPDDEHIVISFHEPIGYLAVSCVAVVQGGKGFGCQVVLALWNIESHRSWSPVNVVFFESRKFGIKEDRPVASFRPCLTNCFGLSVSSWRPLWRSCRRLEREKSRMWLKPNTIQRVWFENLSILRSRFGCSTWSIGQLMACHKWLYLLTYRNDTVNDADIHA